jgi:perosamine synthetase
MKYIPVNRPLIRGNELNFVSDCIKSGWISAEGSYVKKFEKKFAKLVSRKYAVSVSSGTAALDIAIKSINIKKGDEVIVPAFTIISCLHQIVRQGGKPVLVDSDPLTWNIDVSKIEKKISKKTKAIIIVHIYGLPVDIYPVIKIAKKYNLIIIEDAAEELGQFYKNKPIGCYGHISTFSFFANKHITTGEGGMIVTNNRSLAQKFSMLKNICFNPKKQRFIHDDIGWNYRMTSIQAAFGLAQLKNLKLVVKKKRFLGDYYSSKLKNIKNIQLPLKETNYAKNIYWVYGIVLKKKNSLAKKYIKILKKEGVECRPFFCPMHLQPVFKKMNLFKNEKFPVSENLFERGFYIPSGTGTTKKEMQFVINKIKKVFNRKLL